MLLLDASTGHYSHCFGGQSATEFTDASVTVKFKMVKGEYPMRVAFALAAEARLGIPYLARVWCSAAAKAIRIFMDSGAVKGSLEVPNERDWSKHSARNIKESFSNAQQLQDWVQYSMLINNYIVIYRNDLYGIFATLGHACARTSRRMKRFRCLKFRRAQLIYKW